MAKIIYQNYDWFFKADFKDNDLSLNNFNNFCKVDIPHTNKNVPLNNFNEEISQITSIYKKIINISDLSKIYHLVFEGIAHYSKLYINGNYVAEHKCGYTRFEVNITKYLNKGDNEIAVVVDAHEINQPPFGLVIDYLCFGGIYRDCYLKVSNKTHFVNNYFHYEKDNFSFDYDISTDEDVTIALKVFDDNNIIIDKEVNNKKQLTGKLNNYILWDIDNPYLYTLNAKILNKNHETIDEITYKIGFRFIKATEKGFYLNDKKIKIRGLNRHQSYPYVGYAMPSSMQKEDAKTLKSVLNVNAVRTSHYPQDPSFLDACDELGLLVFEEIPGWQNIGDDNWQKIVLDNTQNMILRDRHHPCIFLWGVRINESKDNDELYIKTNKIAHDLDPYRPTGGVRCITHSHLFEDVYTYNDFCCTGNDISLRDKSYVTTTNKPYMVTEYCGHMFPTKPFDTEERRTHHARIHANVLKASLNDDNIMGTFGWCFADYNTHKDFGSGDLICYHGVCDIFRNTKYAAFPYMVYQDEPFLEITCSFNIGEYNGGYIKEFAIITNCDEVKMYHGDMFVKSFVINDFKNEGFINVTDLICDLLITNENMSLSESNKTKEIIKEVLSYDGVIRKETTDKYGVLETETAWNYYGKYVANWGSRVYPYRFEGYKNNKLVLTKYRGNQYIKDIKVSLSSDTLYTKKSYDVCKITLEAIGSLNNRVEYAFDSFKVEVSDNLEVIGDDLISLSNGIRSFYVKSKAKKGNGIINIKSPRFTIEPIQILIKEEER